MKKIKKYLPLILFLAALVASACLIFSRSGSVFDIPGQNSPAPSPTPEAFKKSPLSGLVCANAERRPIAVMLSGDTITRPLSGLAQADLVLEMPVITNGINRLMAVYVCGDPAEIGSIRSARDDFIPLASGWDAIYAHWGGSHFALDKLKNGVINELDALVNPGEAFFRQSGIAAPHNGFSSMSRLVSASQQLGFRLTDNFSGYPHLENFEPATTTPMILSIAYLGEFQVKYKYNPAANNYLRWRGGVKEMDKNTKIQVAPNNVVIMKTAIHQIEGQYNDVKVTGQGEAIIYRNGEEIKGVWKKDAASQKSKLFFLDAKGQEIKFTPGQIWVEIVEAGTGITYE